MSSIKHKMLVKGTAALSAMTMTMFMALPATFASVSTCTNSTTQSGSTNVCTNTVSTTTTVNNTNNAAVNNTVNQSANTGGNVISSVNGNVAYATGMVDMDTALGTAVNSNLTLLNLGTGGVTLTGMNNITGANSVNTTNNVYSGTTAVANNNSMGVSNGVSSTSNTGANIVTSVNGDVGGATGNVVSDVGIATTGNENVTGIMGTGGGAVITSGNSTTQSGSVNIADSTYANVLSVGNNNTAQVGNMVAFMANSGANVVDSINGDVNPFTTGAIGSAVGIENEDLNSNHTTVAQGAGVVQVTTGNEFTQSDSVNSATASVMSVLSVGNTNSLGLMNSVMMMADTGMNFIGDVNGNVAFLSGGVGLANMVHNSANENVNNFNATGLIGSLAGNSNTQSNSTNVAASNMLLSLAVANGNLAGIDNQSLLTGSSGLNALIEVNGNVGLGTGPVLLNSGAHTMANMNSTLFGGFGTSTETAFNLMTQSGSFNSAANLVSLLAGATNSNNLLVGNNNVNAGNTGGNTAFDVNGMLMLILGGVGEGSNVTVVGNVNSSTL